MKNCRYCAEEIQDAAIVCKHCGRDLVEGVTAPSLKQNSKARMCGLVGAFLLAVGVFLPIARMPIVGSVNYFRNGSGDGAILLMVAGVAALVTLRQRYSWLLPTGIVSLGMLTVVWLSFRSKIADMQIKMSRDLSDNPFRGIAEAMTQSVQLEWGWAVMFAGAALLLVGAFIEGKRPSWLAIAATVLLLVPMSAWAYLEL